MSNSKNADDYTFIIVGSVVGLVCLIMIIIIIVVVSKRKKNNDLSSNDDIELHRVDSADTLGRFE